MKIAVTYEMGQIFQHFGHCAHFKIYETEDGAVAALRILVPISRRREAAIIAEMLPLYRERSIPFSFSSPVSSFFAAWNRLRTVLGGSSSILAISESFIPS